LRRAAAAEEITVSVVAHHAEARGAPVSLGVTGEQQRCTEKRAAESSVTMRGCVVFAAGGGNQQGGAGANRFPTSERICAAGSITLSCAGPLGALKKWMQPKLKKRTPGGFNGCFTASWWS
jgi:hypothetical protein